MAHDVETRSEEDKSRIEVSREVWDQGKTRPENDVPREQNDAVCE